MNYARKLEAYFVLRQFKALRQELKLQIKRARKYDRDIVIPPQLAENFLARWKPPQALPSGEKGKRTAFFTKLNQQLERVPRGEKRTKLSELARKAKRHYPNLALPTIERLIQSRSQPGRRKKGPALGRAEV